MPGLSAAYAGDPDRLLSDMDVRLFEEWRTLYGFEPWSDERSDLAAGINVMHAVGCHGGMPKPPLEYMPYLKRLSDRQQKPMTQAQMKATVREIIAAASKVAPKPASVQCSVFSVQSCPTPSPAKSALTSSATPAG